MAIATTYLADGVHEYGTVAISVDTELIATNPWKAVIQPPQDAYWNGIVIGAGKRLILRNCVIRNAWYTGVKGDSTSLLELDHCWVHHNHGSGVLQAGGTGGDLKVHRSLVEFNGLSKQFDHGIYPQKDYDIRRSIIDGNGGWAISAFPDGGTGTTSNSIIASGRYHFLDPWDLDDVQLGNTILGFDGTRNSAASPATNWTISTAYSAGDIVRATGEAGQPYYQTTAGGTSGGTDLDLENGSDTGISDWVRLADSFGWDKTSIIVTRPELIADPYVEADNTALVLDSERRFYWRPSVQTWAISTVYAAGELVESGTDGFRYRCTVGGTSGGDDTDLGYGSDTGVTWILAEGAYGSELTLEDCLAIWGDDGMFAPWSALPIFPGDFPGLPGGEPFHQIAIDPTFSGVTGALAADYNRQWRLPAATVGGGLLWGVKDTLATTGNYLTRDIEGGGADNSYLIIAAVADAGNYDWTLTLKIDAKTMTWELANQRPEPLSAVALSLPGGAIEADYTLPDGTNFFAATVTISSLRA